MSADLIHPGHIKFIEKIRSKYMHPDIVIGLLKKPCGKKKYIMSYEDRKYVLESLRCVDEVVPQNGLDFYNNLIKYGCMAIASGDGWEKMELFAIAKWIDYHTKEMKKVCKELHQPMPKDSKWKPQVLNIRLKGEKNGRKLYSSTKYKRSFKEK